MHCERCAMDLSGGYQSSRNLQLCEPCADLAEQGHVCAGDNCVCIGGDENKVGEYCEDDRTIHDMYDDADALASAGWGTDEDYGYYGGED